MIFFMICQIWCYCSLQFAALQFIIFSVLCLQLTLFNSFSLLIANDRYRRRNIKDLHKMLHRCNEQLQQFSHVNKKALDQYINFTEQREELQKRQAELDAGDEVLCRDFHLECPLFLKESKVFEDYTAQHILLVLHFTI